MSADNYYVIRKHPQGGYAAVQGFASDENMPEANSGYESFVSINEALNEANKDYSEYGVSVHKECYDEFFEGDDFTEEEYDSVAEALWVDTAEVDINEEVEFLKDCN